MKSIKNIKLDCTIKYILTLLIILIIIYIVYHSYKNKYEHLTTVAKTIKPKINTSFYLKNIGNNSFYWKIYALNYTNNSLTRQLIKDGGEHKDDKLKSNKTINTGNLTSGNIGFQIKLYAKFNRDDTYRKTMNIEITPCKNSTSTCNSNLELLSASDTDGDIESMADVRGKFKIDKIINSGLTTYKIISVVAKTGYYVSFYIK